MKKYTKKKKIYIKFKYKKILYFNIKIFIFKKSIIKFFFLYQKKIFYKKKIFLDKKWKYLKLIF